MKVGDLFAQMQIDFSTFNKDERLAKQRTETLGSSLSGVLKNAFSFTLGMGFFQAVQRGFKSTIGSAISFSDTLEQATIGFTTMLGGARRADAFLSRLADFAAHTPFEFEGLLDASKRMMALGFAADDVIPTMTAIGDAAAALGSGQQGIDSLITGLGNIKTQGKVTSIAMMQLARAGVPAWDILAESIGKTTGETRKLVEQGLVSADQGIAALVAGMEKRFPGMMSKMEDSWRGVTATIKDVWSMTLGEMTKGLFGNVTEWLKGIRDTMQGFYDALKSGGLQYAIQQTFGAGVATSVGTLVSALKGLWSMVTGVAGAIVRNWTLIRNLTLGVAWAFSSFKIASLAVGAAARATSLLATVTGLLRGEAMKTSLTTGFLSKVVEIYNYQLHLASMAGIAHVGVLQVLKTAIYSVAAALGTLLWPLLIIGAVLGIGVTAWSKYNATVQKAAHQAQAAKMAEQQKAYTESVNEAAKGTDTQAEALANLGKAANKNLQSFDEVHTLMDDMGDVPGLDIPEMDVATPGIDAFDDLFGGMFDGFEQPAASFKGFVGWLVDGVKEKFSNFKTWLGGTWVAGFWDGVTETWSGFKEWAGGFWEGTKAAWGGFKEWVAGWAGPMWDGVKNTWSNFKEFAADMWDGAKEKWSGFKEFAGTTWDGIKTSIREKWNVLVTEAPIVWENIKTAVSTKWEELRTEAPIVWSNIKDVISTKWEELKIAAPLAWGNIKDSITARWEELRVSAPVVWEGIRSELSTRWNALKTEAPLAWESVKQSIVDRFNAAKTSVIEAARNIRDNVPRSWNEMLGKLNATKDAVRKAIVEPFTKAKETVLGIIDDAKNWGKNLMSNITDGIKSKVNSVKTAVSNAASAIKDFLGFSSPTREGPGRDADRWAPNLMRMYAQGISSNVGMVQSAANEAARGLAAMSALNVAPAFAGVGSGTSSSGIGNNSSAASPQPEIHWHLHGVFIADDYGLKRLEQKLRSFRIAEDQRVGDAR